MTAAPKGLISTSIVFGLKFPKPHQCFRNNNIMPERVAEETNMGF